jgi:hypothetical protein
MPVFTGLTVKHQWLANELLGHHARTAPRRGKETAMKQQIPPRSLRYKISNISRGWLCRKAGLSGKPPFKPKQLRTNARLTNLPQQTIGPGFFLADLLDMNAELPYTTVVEGVEEFLHQSELPPRA